MLGQFVNFLGLFAHDVLDDELSVADDTYVSTFGLLSADEGPLLVHALVTATLAAEIAMF